MNQGIIKILCRKETDIERLTGSIIFLPQPNFPLLASLIQMNEVGKIIYKCFIQGLTYRYPHSFHSSCLLFPYYISGHIFLNYQVSFLCLKLSLEIGKPIFHRKCSLHIICHEERVYNTTEKKSLYTNFKNTN